MYDQAVVEADLRQQVEQLKADAIINSDEVDTAREILESRQHELEKQLRAAQTDAATSQEAMASAQEQLQELQRKTVEQIADLKHALGAADVATETLAQDKASLEGELAALGAAWERECADLAAANQRCATIADEKQALAERWRDADGQLVLLRQQVNSLQADAAAAEQRCSDLIAERNAVEAQLAAVREDETLLRRTLAMSREGPRLRQLRCRHASHRWRAALQMRRPRP